MADRKTGANDKRQPSQPSSGPNAFRLRAAGEVVVTHKETAAKAPASKHIHPRRPLPLIPEAPSRPGGEEVRQKDQSGSKKPVPK